MRDYAIEKGFQYRKVKNSCHRVTTVFTVDGCPFRVHASSAPIGSIFVIKTLNDKHTCQVVKKNKLASSTWIAAKLANNFKDCLNLDLKGIRSILRHRYELFVPATKLYKARRKAKGDTLETHQAKFIILRGYAIMVLTTNPYSVA